MCFLHKWEITKEAHRERIEEGKYPFDKVKDKVEVERFCPKCSEVQWLKHFEINSSIREWHEGRLKGLDSIQERQGWQIVTIKTYEKILQEHNPPKETNFCPNCGAWLEKHSFRYGYNSGVFHDSPKGELLSITCENCDWNQKFKPRITPLKAFLLAVFFMFLFLLSISPLLFL